MRYLNISQLACDLTFAWFLVSWLITRHVLFLFAIVSTYTDCPRLIPFEWTPERGRYLSKVAWIVFCTLLSALQVVLNLDHSMIMLIMLIVGVAGDLVLDDLSGGVAGRHNRQGCFGRSQRR